MSEWFRQWMLRDSTAFLKVWFASCVLGTAIGLFIIWLIVRSET